MTIEFLWRASINGCFQLWLVVFHVTGFEALKRRKVRLEGSMAYLGLVVHRCVAKDGLGAVLHGRCFFFLFSEEINLAERRSSLTRLTPGPFLGCIKHSRTIHLPKIVWLKGHAFEVRSFLDLAKQWTSWIFLFCGRHVKTWRVNQQLRKEDKVPATTKKVSEYVQNTTCLKRLKGTFVSTLQLVAVFRRPLATNKSLPGFAWWF